MVYSRTILERYESSSSVLPDRMRRTPGMVLPKPLISSSLAARILTAGVKFSPVSSILEITLIRNSMMVSPSLVSCLMRRAMSKWRICFSVTLGFLSSLSGLSVFAGLGSDLGRGRTDAYLGMADSGMRRPNMASHSADLMRWLTVASRVLPCRVSTRNWATISPSPVRRCMVASMVIRSIIINRTGVSRGELGEFGGNLRGFWAQGDVGGEFSAGAQGAQRGAVLV